MKYLKIILWRLVALFVLFNVCYFLSDILPNLKEECEAPQHISYDLRGFGVVSFIVITFWIVGLLVQLLLNFLFKFISIPEIPDWIFKCLFVVVVPILIVVGILSLWVTYDTCGQLTVFEYFLN